jgi:hypothetical protein
MAPKSASLEFRHIAMLCQYAGISFISGAVNHGMFSGERSLMTAFLGIAIYLGGAFLTRLDSGERTSLQDLMGYGVIASIGLGFFTGGLQHFPDSPERSVWVVPLGYVMSLIAFYSLEGRGMVSQKAMWRFGAISSTIVIAASLGAWGLFDFLGHDHSGHSH